MNTVLITGSSRGIGREIAEEFAVKGYAIAINYSKSKEQAISLSNKIMKEYKVPCNAYKADVKSREEVKSMVDSIRSDLGSIVILVNNAGISTQKMFTDLTLEDWKAMLSTHLDGAFNCTQEVLPHMIQRHRGKIINISSMWGVTGGSCEVHYSTAKAGIIGFTKALAKEVAPSGINVNCICPGVIKTHMLNIFDEETLESLKNQTALKRLGKPRDIAKGVLFLASEEANYITGAVININGGIFM